MVEALGLADALQTALVLAVAFALGTLIGVERQDRQRNAGLRTNVLVALGAASFVRLGVDISGAAGATQIVAYVVSGVGFLGAGVIMREGGEVRGLNTAATLWGSAAVGAACGAQRIGQAVVVTALVLAGSTLLRPLVNAINRTPLDQSVTEASCEVRAGGAQRRRDGRARPARGDPRSRQLSRPRRVGGGARDGRLGDRGGTRPRHDRHGRDRGGDPPPRSLAHGSASVLDLGDRGLNSVLVKERASVAPRSVPPCRTVSAPSSAG